MKKRSLTAALAAVLMISMLGGCGQGTAADTSGTADTKTEATATDSTAASNDTTDKDDAGSAETTTITIWHSADATIADTLQAQVDSLAPEIEVRFERKENMSDALKLVGDDPANAPDMYMWAHDKVGTFAQMRIISPITEVISADSLSDIIPMTLEAGSYKGENYQLPLYYEAIMFL